MFEAATIERMLEHYGNLLTEVIANPERRSSALRLSSAAELTRVLEEWSEGGQVEYSQQTLPELFEAQVTRNGEAMALLFGRGRLVTKS